MAAYPLHHMFVCRGKGSWDERRGEKKGHKEGELQYCALSVKNCVDVQPTCLGYVMDLPGL